MEVLSCIPGRIRVKDISLYRNMDLASKLSSELYNMDSIYFVKINIYTGKLLIVYDKDIVSLEGLFSKIESWVMTDNEVRKQYLSIDSSENELGQVYQQVNEKKSMLSPIFDNRIIDVFFKPALLISVCIGLTLLSGQCIIIPKFLLLILLYKFILSVLNSFYKRRLSIGFEYKSNKDITSYKSDFENSVIKFYDSVIPMIMVIAILYSLIIANFTPLLSIVFLLTFNSLNRSTSMVLDSISNRLRNKGIFLISFNKLNKLSNLSTVIIDKTQDKSNLETMFIEHLREHGFYDIHIFTTNFNIESQAKNLELVVFRVGDNDFEKIKYIRSLKQDDKKIALLTKESANITVLNEVDIGICFANKLGAIDTEHWDLVIDSSNYNTLGETVDYIKYALEKIYQNQLISLWLNVLGIVLSFSKKVQLIFIGLFSIASEILVYLNSLRLLDYEPIYE